VTLGIVVGVLAILALWRWVIWWVGWRKVDAPLTAAWIAQHQTDTTKEQWWSGK